ncbi:Dam family site-specific DNA-(adenine-N6)-methyltransferase [Sorangium sp. So ce321]|uniref:DNA adenine methylase n=1 Tax=Sorangium sp. So ce321 TaxID=3133300 RepID=UPI003F5DBAC3
MSALPHQRRSHTSAVSDTAHPFIKWAGGKRQLLPNLLRFVPTQYGTYFEPFVGGAALFFALRPPKAVLSDLNERLIRTYRGVASDVEGVIDSLSRWPYDRDFFEKLRKADTSQMSDAELAAWFVYLNRTGFNGLYRVNKSNQFNVPFGSYANPKICDADALRTCSVALRMSAELKICDFEAAVCNARAGDFVYFDPPYVPISEYSNFTRYTADTFGSDDQQRLRDVALRLKRIGVNVLLSNSSAPAVYELYSQGFEICAVNAKRALNCKADRRGAVAELIIR